MESQSTQPRLHSPTAITVATVIGSPVAGALLLAQNFRTIGNRHAAWHYAIFGLSTTLILIGLAFFLNLPPLLLPIIYCVAMYNLAVVMHRRHFRSYIESGASVRSLWLGIGIGFGCLLVLLGIQYLLASLDLR